MQRVKTPFVYYQSLHTTRDATTTTIANIPCYYYYQSTHTTVATIPSTATTITLHTSSNATTDAIILHTTATII